MDLHEPLQDALQVVQPGAEAKGVRIIVKVDPAGTPVYGDAARLQQIAWNLLSNAVKFTGEGGVVYVSLRRARGGAELTVTDTGEGIAPEFLPRVFDAFRQADASTTRVQPGLGLGLSIVKSLVEAHGGTIAVHSDGPGGGATFVARFPIRAAESPAPARTAAALPAPQPAALLQGISVLVVDDDEASREVIAAHLHFVQARVITAPSARRALDALRAGEVDVILADIGMPEEDGYSFIRRIRGGEVPSAALIPAAALTAFAREEDRVHAFEAGFQLHLPKPIDPQLLVAAVVNLHRRRLEAAC